MLPVTALGFESLRSGSREDGVDGDSILLAAKLWEHLRVGLTMRSLCPLWENQIVLPKGNPCHIIETQGTASHISR